MQPCEQRDLSFWRAVASHPEVAPALQGRSFDSMAPLFLHEQVLPLATKNGGMIFVKRDDFGKVRELHALYKPEGWGKEALLALKSCLRRVFSDGAEIVYANECVGLWRTRPPKSFGFVAQGEPFGTKNGARRFWLLTRAAWEMSPACARGREIH